MEIQSSKNYDMFVYPTWQREINENAVYDMAARMEKENPELAKTQPISCIAVEGKEVGSKHSLLVWDGQHRLEARKLLSQEICYTITPHGMITAERVASMNSHQRPWKTVDYVKSFSSRNKQGYVWYKKLVEDYELNMSFFRLLYLPQIHAQFTNITMNYLDHFKSGLFDPTDEFKRSAKLFCIDLDSLQQELRGTNLYKRSGQYHFMRAFSIMRLHPKFDLNSFKIALPKYFGMMTMSNRIEDTISEMVAIYNYRRRTGKLDITFSKISGVWHYV